jgi:hypothetical protein
VVADVDVSDEVVDDCCVVASLPLYASTPASPAS